MDISKFHHYARFHSLNWYEQTKRRLQFNKKKQAEFLLAFAKPMSVGRTAFSICKHIERFGDPKQKIIITEIQKNLQSGEQMSKALIGWYDPLTVAALSAAEKGGEESLLIALEHVSNQLQKEQETGAKAFLKLLYPGIGWVLTTLVIIAMNIYFLPMVKEMSRGGSSPAIESFEAVAFFYTYLLWPILLFGFVGIYFINRMLREYIGPHRDLIDSFTVYKWKPFEGYRLKIGAYIVSSFSLLKRFGLPAFSILKILESTGSQYQRFHVANMSQALTYGNGNEIEALNTGLLEEQYVSLLRLYTADNDDHAVEALDKAANDINERCIKRIQTTGNIFYYAAWGAVLFNLIKVASVILGMNQQT